MTFARTPLATAGGLAISPRVRDLERAEGKHDAAGGDGEQLLERLPCVGNAEIVKPLLNQVARRIGNRAYLKARLDLTPEQMPLWTAFEKAADEASAKDKARCASLPAETKTPPNFIERYIQRDERMKARVESLEAVKPSLQALYASLTPEQKAILDRPMMGGMHMHHHRG